MNDRDIEKLEVLNGDRRLRIDRAAVRIEDFQGLLQLLPDLQSTTAGGSIPTKEEFDALVQDVKHLHERVLSLAEAIRSRQSS